MALEINRPTPKPVGLVADRRLCLTSDKSAVVEDGSPDAAWLLASPGQLILADEVARLGLECVDGRLVQKSAAKAEPAKEPAKPDPLHPTPKLRTRGA